MSVAGGWSDGQVSVFARRFAQSAEGRAWWAFVDDVREALIDQHIFLIVLAQNKGEVKLEEVRSLRTRFARRLQDKHGLRNQFGEVSS